MPAEEYGPSILVQTASLLLRLALSMKRWLVKQIVCVLLTALLISPLPFLRL